MIYWCLHFWCTDLESLSLSEWGPNNSGGRPVSNICLHTCCTFCVCVWNGPTRNAFCFRFYKACRVFFFSHQSVKSFFLSNSLLYHPPVTVRPLSSNIPNCSKLSEYCENGHDYNPPSQGQTNGTGTRAICYLYSATALVSLQKSEDD